MPISINSLITVLKRHVDAGDHHVFVDGVRQGTCTRASFRFVVIISGIEFPVDYAYELNGVTTTFSSRLRAQNLGPGGRERILVNGQDVEHDDVLIGEDLIDDTLGVYIEFKYSSDGADHRVKFFAPLTAFREN